MEKNCEIFLFDKNSYDLEKVESYSYEECLSLVTPLTLEEFDFYNSPDSNEYGLDDYIRVFSFGKNVQVYLVTEEVSYPIVYTDGIACDFGGACILFDDEDHDDVYLIDIPTTILDNLCERTAFVKKVSVVEYEKLHNTEEWPLYVTFRIMPVKP